ncbi:MAG: hypothetical protein R3328_00195 [Planococcaceae bacterium]|nr:hypothetical protein [Planococcaceae bacterium]
MKLNGGIDTYQFDKRYKTEEPPLGRKVTFLNDNGYEVERGTARNYFYENQLLTVKEIYVGRSSSMVEFLEVPNKQFNTVMFEDVDSE